MTSPARPGQPAERTSLAWRRTALSVTVGSLVGLRVLPPQLGALGYLVSALGLLWGIDLTLTAGRRYRDGRQLLSGRTTATTVGATLARTAVTSAVFAVFGLSTVIVLSRR